MTEAVYKVVQKTSLSAYRNDLYLVPLDDAQDSFWFVSDMDISVGDRVKLTLEKA